MGKLFDDDEVPRVAMQVTRNVLVVSVQIELYDASLKALREDLLANIRRTGVRRALVDLSAVEVMDSYAYVSICDTANMAKVMGADTVLTGIKPGVASALVELDVDVKRTVTALNLETGFALLDGRVDGDEPEADEHAEIADDDAAVANDPDIGNLTDGPPNTAGTANTRLARAVREAAASARSLMS